jgi:hypothetical protein
MKKFKIKFEKPIYGWIRTEIENPINKKRNVKINHSGVYPFYQELIEILGTIKYKKKAKLIIEEEGPNTIIEFYNKGNVIEVKYIKLCKKSLKENYSYYFKPFKAKYNKKEFIKEYKEKLMKHYLKNKKDYLDDNYWFMFNIMDLKKL